MCRVTSISQAMAVVRRTGKLTSFSAPACLLNMDPIVSPLERSSVAAYLASTRALPSSDPWTSLHRAAKFMAAVGSSSPLVTVLDTFLRFPRAISSRMDYNGKHLLVSGKDWESVVSDAILFVVKGAHVTVDFDACSLDKSIRAALENPASPIQTMPGVELPRIAASPMDIPKMLSAVRLVRPMLEQRQEFEIPDECLELLTFLDPKDAAIFERETLHEVLEVMSGVDPVGLAGRNLDAFLQTSSPLCPAVVKHIALAWLNPLASTGANRLVLQGSGQVNENIKRLVRFVENRLGFEVHRGVPSAEFDRVRIGGITVDSNALALRGCDTDPFMLASQYLFSKVDDKLIAPPRSYPSRIRACRSNTAIENE